MTVGWGGEEWLMHWAGGKDREEEARELGDKQKEDLRLGRDQRIFCCFIVWSQEGGWLANLGAGLSVSQKVKLGASLFLLPASLHPSTSSGSLFQSSLGFSKSCGCWDKEWNSFPCWAVTLISGALTTQLLLVLSLEWFSKCGPWTSAVGTTMEPVRNAHPQAHLRPAASQALGRDPGLCVSARPPWDPGDCSSLRTTTLVTVGAHEKVPHLWSP